MRRSLVAGILVGLVLLSAPVRTTLATWNDQSTVSGAVLTTGALAAPVLSCGPPGLGLSVRISWPIQTTGVPATPTYVATIPGVTVPPPTVSEGIAYVDITSALLASLVAGTKTVSVRGTLPSNWTSPTSTININFILIGLLVSC
jgi:hypothetical protein